MRTYSLRSAAKKLKIAYDDFIGLLLYRQYIRKDGKKDRVHANHPLSFLDLVKARKRFSVGWTMRLCTFGGVKYGITSVWEISTSRSPLLVHGYVTHVCTGVYEFLL